MNSWLNELLQAIKEKKDLPLITDEEIMNEEDEDDAISEELGKS